MAALSLRRGDRRTWTQQFLSPAGNPQNLNGWTVWWTLRPNVPGDPSYDLPDAEGVIKATWKHTGAAATSQVIGPDGRTDGGAYGALNVAQGQLQLDLYPALTTLLASAPPGSGGQWRYDIQVQAGSDPKEIHTWDEGTLSVRPDVTRRTSTP